MSIITDTYYENKSVKKHIYMYYKKCYRTNNCMQIEEIKYDITIHKKGSGVGLVNVNNRIKILFGERYGLHIESELDEGTVVTIKIPAIVYSEENRLQFEEHHIA